MFDRPFIWKNWPSGLTRFWKAVLKALLTAVLNPVLPNGRPCRAETRLLKVLPAMPVAALLAPGLKVPPVVLMPVAALLAPLLTGLFVIPKSKGGSWETTPEAPGNTER